MGFKFQGRTGIYFDKDRTYAFPTFAVRNQGLPRKALTASWMTLALMAAQSYPVGKHYFFRRPKMLLAQSREEFVGRWPFDMGNPSWCFGWRWNLPRAPIHALILSCSLPFRKFLSYRGTLLWWPMVLTSFPIRTPDRILNKKNAWVFPIPKPLFPLTGKQGF